MITLIRPIESKLSDQIEKRLKDLRAAYNVVNKEVSNIPFLIEDGIVQEGKAIMKFLETWKRPPIGKRDRGKDRF